MNLSDKHKALAEECGASESKSIIGGNVIHFMDEELALYTSKIQAEERERCIAKCEYVKNIYIDQDKRFSEPALLIAAANNCITAIMSLE